jgi:hypothetical protein
MVLPYSTGNTRSDGLIPQALLDGRAAVKKPRHASNGAGSVRCERQGATLFRKPCNSTAAYRRRRSGVANRPVRSAAQRPRTILINATRRPSTTESARERPRNQWPVDEDEWRGRRCRRRTPLKVVGFGHFGTATVAVPNFGVKTRAAQSGHGDPGEEQVTGRPDHHEIEEQHQSPPEVMADDGALIAHKLGG